jgi:hypothetical protein
MNMLNTEHMCVVAGSFVPIDRVGRIVDVASRDNRRRGRRGALSVHLEGNGAWGVGCSHSIVRDSIARSSWIVRFRAPA